MKLLVAHLLFSIPAVCCAAQSWGPVDRPIAKNPEPWVISHDHESAVIYTVEIAATRTKGGEEPGEIRLETSQDKILWSEVSALSNQNIGKLTRGTAVPISITGKLGGSIPAGYWVQIRSISKGSPKFTYLRGWEKDL